MSLNFTTDNSVQLTYTSFPFTTPPLDGYTTSNYVSNISNLLINNINTKQATLTAATNLLGVGTAITAIDYNKITVNKPSTFPADMTNIYSKTETNNLLSAKEATLTFSSPLTRTTNTIGINLSSYSTTGNDANYLLKTGGSMTGDLNIEKLNPIVSIKSTGENQTSILYLSTPLNITSGLKTAIIAEGVSAWGRSKLHFCLNDNQTDNSTSQNASVSHARMTILPSGNIGINNTAPGEKLDVSGNIKTTGNIDCGGGIALTGANAFYETSIVTDTNETNTYINFKFAGSSNDWCYLRQLGGNNVYKLAFDFHDDNNDARFCLRSVQSAGAEPDNMVEVFTVDNGNTTMTGTCTATSFSGSGANLTNLPLSAYSTTGNDVNYLLKTGGTLTGTLNGPTINATTALQEAGTNLTSKYLQLAGGSMTANANITLSGTGTFTGIHSGNGAALTNLPLSAYSTTGNDANYLLKTGGTLTGTLNGTTIFTTGNIGVGTNNQIASLVVGNIDADGSDGSIAFSKRQNSGVKRNFKMGMNGDYTFCIGDYGGGNTTANPWSSNHFNIRYFDGNVGIGIQGSGSYKLYVDGTTYFNGNSTVNGTLTATTFSGSHTGNGSGLTNLPLSAYSTTGNDASYLLKTGGAMTGQITGVTTLNGTTGIFSTVSTTNNGNANTPQLGVNGGTGDRFILYVGTASLYPYSLGINSDVLWYSVPATASHIFYVGGSPKATISSTGIGITGTLTTTSTISEGGTLLTSKYLKLDGTNTMTGALINTASTTSQFKAIEIAHPARTTHIPYLPNNQIYFRAPVIIDNDADFLSMGSRLGDSIIRLFAEIYSFGINSLTLRYNVPIDAAHRFYTGTNNIFTINSSGVKFNNLVQNKVISLWDVAPANDFQFSGLGTNGGLTLNIPNNSTDSIIFKAGASATATTELMRIQGSGNVGIGTNNPRSLLHIKGTNTTLTIMGQGGSGAKSQINLSTYDHTTNLAPCSLIATDNGNFGSTFQINQKTSGADTNAQFISFIIYPSGNVGINTNNPQYKLQVEGTTYFNGASIISGDLTLNGGSLTINKTSPVFIVSSTEENQHSTILLGTPFQNVGAYKCAIIAEAASSWSRSKLHFCLNNVADNTRGTQNASLANSRVNIDYDGNMNVSGRTFCNGGLNIQVNSWVYDTNGAQRIYFGSGARTYYQGYGQYTTDINHEWRNHVGTGVMFLSYTGSLLLSGEIIPNMTSIGTSGTDCCGVSFNSSQGTTYQTSIKIIYGTFTGFHRCFTDDIEFNEEEPQKFKDDYIGRIVISTGKIATDTKIENEEEWTIKYGKEGITIEDALPIIQLSRTKKDKRVFGVLGMPSRNNSRVERMIVNSVGEGGIWICNSNGNIENGDYIQSSNHLGYGEKQDDDLLHNYTVAKATIECNFELDSPLYECQELEGGLRVAFIACTYHCG